jgi:hypothetical protein
MLRVLRKTGHGCNSSANKSRWNEVTIDKPIDRVPPVREEEDCIIFPVVEEVLKIQRVLILR